MHDEGFTACPECPGIGQYLPDRQREQFSLGGSSTVLRNRPYFLRGMAWCLTLGL